MTIKTVLQLIVGMAWIITLNACDGTTEQPSARPNILFIMVSDESVNLADHPGYATVITELQRRIAENIEDRGSF